MANNQFVLSLTGYFYQEMSILFLFHWAKEVDLQQFSNVIRKLNLDTQKLDYLKTQNESANEIIWLVMSKT